MAKVVVFGANGQLGRALQTLKLDAVFLTHKDCDVTSFDAVKKVAKANVDAKFIINATGYTNVDGAEHNLGLAEAVNSDAVGNLAQAANWLDATLIHISTDYVFAGDATEPYKPSDVPNPQSVYGDTKYSGELYAATATKHYIVRTSWLYGDGNNFVRTMLRLGVLHSGHSVSVVADQFGLPTYALDLAWFCQFLINSSPPKPYGIYHFSNGGDPISWADFAETIFRISKLECKVERVSTEEYLQAKLEVLAPRPKYSALDCSANSAFSTTQDKQNFYTRGWYAALMDYLGNK